MPASSPVPIYQVSELVKEMQHLMEASYPNIWIEGELSSLSKPASGHWYFQVKDEQSQLQCAMFSSRSRQMSYRPKVGDKVRIRGKISIYPARGNLQCIVQHIEEAGEGLLQRRYEELKVKLEQQGLFSAEHKQAIPSFVQHCGIITSPSGAAISDILTTLKRRYPALPVTIYPAVVQGETAAQTLIQAIKDAVQHQTVDLLVISRGGGSLEDLWCFNDENLAQAIFDCPIPSVSAVGHEVDVTIADLVADLRAPTPTAAAELISPDRQQLLQNLEHKRQHLLRASKRLLEQRAQMVDLKFANLQHPRTRIEKRHHQLQQLNQKLKSQLSVQLAFKQKSLINLSSQFKSHSPETQIKQQVWQLSQYQQRMKRALSHNFSSQQSKLDSISQHLNAVSPLATLDRGFAIVRDQQQAIIRDSDAAQTGDEISIQLKSGKLRATVTTTDKK